MGHQHGNLCMEGSCEGPVILRKERIGQLTIFTAKVAKRRSELPTRSECQLIMRGQGTLSLSLEGIEHPIPVSRT